MLLEDIAEVAVEQAAEADGTTHQAAVQTGDRTSPQPLGGRCL